MLSRSLRIRYSREYSQIYRAGKRISSQNLRLSYLAKPNQNFSRFGFVISKRDVKKIVSRNRLKRVLRAYVRENLGRFLPGLDIVIGVRPGIRALSSQEIWEELGKLFQKGKFLIKL